ncbi:hypothetical protein AB0B88_10385 [Micromonospora haikouensis]|uniref:hypothetical protein n=1 Tax=Micromonospora haikouensis TaxID=686309 RepID=UPI0033E88E7E
MNGVEISGCQPAMRIDAAQQRGARMVRGNPPAVGVGDLVVEADKRTASGVPH